MTTYKNVCIWKVTTIKKWLLCNICILMKVSHKVLMYLFTRDHTQNFSKKPITVLESHRNFRPTSIVEEEDKNHK
jgi:hypothetical protein